ncbi:extracellular solute-binding protein [Nocardioides cynanchi]|uniref:extracellular solute-binding protein n=1 Tax=Nocardioides cynanchi TaxID=2558918 RepID=UPI001245A23E|nr:extracellular solute-binding protein [Nocardioides cynanchi]
MIPGPARRSRALAGLLAAGLLGGSGLLAACGSGSAASSGPTSPPTSSPTSSPTRLPDQTLTFGVVGDPGEVAAYRQMTSQFAPLSRHVTVQVESWPDEGAMMAALRGGAQPPDVFLAARRDLPWLTAHQDIQPVDHLLDDRGVDFGDDYPRDSLTALASDNRLQCLPYAIEPSVIYYNKRLVRFGQMRVDPPTPGQGWSLAQFAATARWAVRHHPGVSGLYVEPSLIGIAPFLYSGGGQLYDNATTPTSLALSSSGSQGALAQALPVLGKPSLTPSPAELQQQTPLELFESGRLAMLAGSRDLVPELRGTSGLDFDVMPMPTLGSAATVGSLTGLCVSQHARDAATAAEFVVYASSPEALSTVAAAGYLQPANQTVALSDAFQQPGRLPAHASVFTFGIKSMIFPPVVDEPDALSQQVDPLIARLFTADPTRVPRLSRHIDRISQPILAPPVTGSPSPTSSQSTG